MQRISIFILFSFFSLNSLFATTTSIECYQKRPEWLVKFETDESQAIFTWIWNGEIEDLPLQEGVTTGRTLPFLDYQMKEMTSFPRLATLIWDKKQCQFAENGTFSCNGKPISSLSRFDHYQLNLNHQTIETAGGNFKSWIFSLAVTTESTTYFMPIKFFANQCSKNEFHK